MTTKILTTLLVFSIFLGGLYKAPQVKGVVQECNEPRQIDKEMLEMVNAERAEPLVLNDKLMITAQERAEDMVERDYWSHIDPDGNNAWYLMKDIGYRYTHAGENLYRYKGVDVTNGYMDEQAVEMWMGSPDHRKNILGDFNELGIGRAGNIIVHHFGKR